MSNANKTPGIVDQTVNRLQIGCLTLFFNLLFGGFCLWGVYAASISWRLETEGQTALGIVTRLEESSDSEGGCCVYSPVVEFAAGGQTYTFEGDNASDPPQYRVGQQVNVRYDPTDPNTAQIDSFFERWLFPIIIIPAMLLTALIVNFFMIRAWWRGSSLEE
ncbi:MAG: DUF3592 domain-containing protein [Anaerolineae bacterium]|nr:DUF3592 domain-containing protein [Anaerolineae bacterium]